MNCVPAAAVAPPSSEFELGGFEINEEELLAPVGVLINSLVPSPGYLVAHFAQIWYLQAGRAEAATIPGRRS